MAKCPVCDSRKGKRQCKISTGLVCSQCCGTIRKEEHCLDCSYYQKPKRKYNEVPSFTTSQMHGSPDLTDYSNAIEGALCTYDSKNNKNLNDDGAIKILELLIDKYHFKDTEINCEDAFLLAGFNLVDKVIRKDLAAIDKLELVKVLSIIYFVAKRRTKTGREYMNVIDTHVGPSIGSRINLLNLLR